jgi:hypothetical protein
VTFALWVAVPPVPVQLRV